MNTRTQLLAIAAFAAIINSASAQQTPPPPIDAIPEKAPQHMDTPSADDGKHGSLSDRLDKSNGVIRPETGVDPGIQKPAPATGAMPIIRPPGDSGGAGNVQPK